LLSGPLNNHEAVRIAQPAL